MNPMSPKVLSSGGTTIDQVPSSRKITTTVLSLRGMVFDQVPSSRGVVTNQLQSSRIIVVKKAKVPSSKRVAIKEAKVQKKHQKSNLITLLATFVSFKTQEEQLLRRLKFQA